MLLLQVLHGTIALYLGEDGCSPDNDLHEQHEMTEERRERCVTNVFRVGLMLGQHSGVWKLGTQLRRQTIGITVERVHISEAHEQTMVLQ